MADSPPRELAHQVSVPIGFPKTSHGGQSANTFSEWKGDKTTDECIRELFYTVQSIANEVKASNSKTDDLDTDLLSLFRMSHEVKKGLKPEVLGENAENAPNRYCLDCAYDVAKSAVQKLAFVLHSPPPSEDLRDARSMRIAERQRTLQLMLDDSTLSIPSHDPNEVDTSGIMSVDNENDEE
jgi:hypothetical protein